ncbi:MAG TPA: 5'/3'-nucleotidase SurE, partial [Syntrophales bacterium]|nr:5'/3'-nucleotidase SurE [Syntrophales bacterium]
MRFLLTNDDGIHARGLFTLQEAFSEKGECLIVAPEMERSAAGHAITLSRPLMIREARKNGEFYGYAVAGTPADSVKIGLREIAGGPVDLVVSGINLGANVGINVLYSGTVSAATEGSILGVPAMAVSLDSRSHEADYAAAAQTAAAVADYILENRSLLTGIALNVNVPNLPSEKIRGVRFTRQGQARLVETYERRLDPRNNVYYWLVGETLQPEDEEE